MEFAGGKGGDHAQVCAAEFAGDGVDITGNFHGQDDLTRMRRVGQHIEQAAGVYGFQDHFEGQSAVPQALLVRIAGKDAHIEISSINSSVGKLGGCLDRARSARSTCPRAVLVPRLRQRPDQHDNTSLFQFSGGFTLSGGTITRGSGVSEVFGNLNLTQASFLNFGTGTAGNLTFGTYQDNAQTESALLTINNFLPGNSFTFNSTSFSQGSINSYFQFGTGFVGYSLGNTGSTFTITPIPEPSTYVAALGLLALMLWPLCRRFRVKQARGHYSERLRI